jgi:predicted alpha/beta-fold hydrolase
MLFRTCGSEMNHARRFYHSGETSDVAFVVDSLLQEDHESPLLMVGVSLGGNVLLKYLGERGANVPKQIRAAAAVSVPFDLSRSSRHIDRGFARLYQWHFLRSLKRKTAQKLVQYPDLVSPHALHAARTLFEFDDAVTAPIHGFAGAEDYYRRSSAIEWIARIEVPVFLLSAVDDPFLPPAVLEEVQAIARSNSRLVLEFPRQGGHVGFVSGANPLRPFYYADWRVAEFLTQVLVNQ